MANVYAIRVHELADDFRDRIVGFVESTGGSYVVARETNANRIHYQGWVRCELKPQTFRVRLKKAFPECIGNKGYSVSAVKDIEAYGRYVLKGTKEDYADVVCACGLEITEEYLAREHRAYWSKAEKPGKSNRSVVEEVHEWVMEKSKMHDITRRDIAKRICDTMAARKKGINTYYIRTLVNTVEWLKDPACQENILDEIVNKY